MKRKSSAPIIVVFVGLIAIAVVAVVLFLRPRGSYAPPPVPSVQPSTDVDVSVYVDVSASMRNFFANNGQTNTFRKFLSNCELALRSGVNLGGWERRTYQAYKFGSKSGAASIPNDGGLRDLSNDPAAFNETGTPIEAAINAAAVHVAKPGAKKLVILVTDLYQSDGKLEKPAEALIHAFLNKEAGAIAVYGVRNPYTGPVTDVPNQSVPLVNAATSMPFYIIIAGERAADVRRAQELLTTGGYGEPLRTAWSKNKLFAVFFSRDAEKSITDPVVFDAHVVPPNKCDSVWCFSAIPARLGVSGQEGAAEPLGKKANALSARQSSFQGDPQGNSIAQLDLKGRNSVIGVSWQRPARQMPPIWRTADTSSRWNVQVSYCPVTKKGPCEKEPLLDKDAAEAIHICNVPDAGGQTICRTECPQTAGCSIAANPPLALLVMRKGLATGRKYLVEIDRVATASDLQADLDEHNALMHRWNLTPEETQNLLARHAFESDRAVSDDAHPGKTPNLSQFLNAFVGAVMSTSRSGETARDGTVLDRYFLYVNAR
jgi:hypothetical protein